VNKYSRLALKNSCLMKKFIENAVGRSYYYGPVWHWNDGRCNDGHEESMKPTSISSNMQLSCHSGIWNCGVELMKWTSKLTCLICIRSSQTKLNWLAVSQKSNCTIRSIGSVSWWSRVGTTALWDWAHQEGGFLDSRVKLNIEDLTRLGFIMCI
jgi:hypothetical protein